MWAGPRRARPRGLPAFGWWGGGARGVPQPPRGCVRARVRGPPLRAVCAFWRSTAECDATEPRDKPASHGRKAWVTTHTHTHRHTRMLAFSSFLLPDGGVRHELSDDLMCNAIRQLRQLHVSADLARDGRHARASVRQSRRLAIYSPQTRIMQSLFVADNDGNQISGTSEAAVVSPGIGLTCARAEHPDGWPSARRRALPARSVATIAASLRPRFPIQAHPGGGPRWVFIRPCLGDLLRPNRQTARRILPSRGRHHSLGRRLGCGVLQYTCGPSCPRPFAARDALGLRPQPLHADMRCGRLLGLDGPHRAAYILFDGAGLGVRIARHAMHLFLPPPARSRMASSGTKPGLSSSQASRTSAPPPGPWQREALRALAQMRCSPRASSVSWCPSRS